MKPQVIVIQGTLYATLTDGSPVQKTLTTAQTEEVKSKMYIDELTDEYLIQLCTPNKLYKDTVKQGVQRLVDSGLFEFKQGSLYRVGNPLTIPGLLVEKFVELIDTSHFEAYDNFWKLCSLNPNPLARQDLFSFLQGGNFSITKSGLFIAYRNVAIKSEGNQELVDFVTKSYVKIKQQKKSPKTFEVYEVAGDYNLYNTKNQTPPEGDYVGVVEDLYLNIDSITGTIYTDNHTKTFKIVPGIPVTMERSDCDGNPGADCSRGLHVGNSSFLTKNEFGQVGLMCLVNPMHVVAVPEYNQNKLRCCEYLPVSVVDYDDLGKIIEIDTNVYEDEYCQYTLDEINEMLEEADMQEHVINSLFEDFDHKVYDEIANNTILERNIYYTEEEE